MKNGKKPSRGQKKLFLDAGLNPLNWLIVKKQHDYLLLIHRETGVLKNLSI